MLRMIRMLRIDFCRLEPLSPEYGLHRNATFVFLREQRRRLTGFSKDLCSGSLLFTKIFSDTIRRTVSQPTPEANPQHPFHPKHAFNL